MHGGRQTLAVGELVPTHDEEGVPVGDGDGARTDGFQGGSGAPLVRVKVQDEGGENLVVAVVTPFKKITAFKITLS